MLIDDITIRVSAGSGGKGKVAFNKNLMSLGPAGGSGGTGGSIFIEAVSDLAVLNRLVRFPREILF
jgi:GTP-binding protein